MKNIRLEFVSAAVCVGTIVTVACGSFTDPSRGSDGGSGGNSSGTVVGSSTAAGDTTNTSQSGGSTNTGASNATSTSNSGTSGTSSAIGGSRTQTSGSASTSTAATGGDTPCSILAAGGQPCVAAHSTVRVIYPGYTGPLYQLCKGAFSAGPHSCKSGMTQNIGSVNGFVDYAAVDAFCPSAGTCTISIIYDQSPNKNDLEPAPAGGTVRSPDNPVDPLALKISISGQKAYGLLITQGTGYRAGCTNCAVVKPTGTATGDQPETEYMVTSSLKTVGGCCFDYGNAETDSSDDGNGTMEAVYFGDGVVWGTGTPGGHQNGVNSWVMADLENGIYAGWQLLQGTTYTDQSIATNHPINTFNFVTAIVVGDVASQNGGKGRFALYGGDATQGNLVTEYDGIRPTKGGYVPMKKQGSIILGTGGDNSNSGGGEWFEGVMASGAASATTLNALQANIVAAGYGK